jgi:hypothetical protein
VQWDQTTHLPPLLSKKEITGLMAQGISLTSLIPLLLPLLLQPLIVTRPPFHRGASIKRPFVADESAERKY